MKKKQKFFYKFLCIPNNYCTFAAVLDKLYFVLHCEIEHKTNCS